MSQLILNTIGPILFSYTGILWGFILAAIAVEELKELNAELNKTRNLLALITTALILYIAISKFTTQKTISILLIVFAISMLLIQQYSKSFKQELYILAPISLTYLSIFFINMSLDKILLLTSSTSLYFILVGINLYSSILSQSKK